jgi:hypothetical protein
MVGLADPHHVSAMNLAGRVAEPRRPRHLDIFAIRVELVEECDDFAGRRLLEPYRIALKMFELKILTSQSDRDHKRDYRE